jgi:ribonuclease Z
LYQLLENKKTLVVPIIRFCKGTTVKHSAVVSLIVCFVSFLFFAFFSERQTMQGVVGREILKARLVVVGTDCVDASPGLMLVCDDMSYLINCGEGTQRICEEYRIKLPKLGHVFFTQLDWKMIGGFPGLLLTMSDIGGEEMGIHGPPGTVNFIASLRYFVKRPDLALRVTSPAAVFQDANVTVLPILISSELDNAQTPAFVPVAEETNVGWTHPNAEDDSVTLGLGKRRAEGVLKPLKQQKKFANPEELAADGGGFRDAPEEWQPMARLVPATTPRRVVSCLEIKLADMRGKFDVERAKALGVKPGKLFSELIRGANVKSETTGADVTPQMCLGPNVEGSVVLVIDCPDGSFCSALFSSVSLQQSLARADIVCHMGCASVVSSPSYAQWLARHCSGRAQHLLLNECCSQVPVFRSAAAVQIALARVATVFAEHCEHPRSVAAPPVWPHLCVDIGDCVTLAPAKLAGFAKCLPRPDLVLKEASFVQGQEGWRDGAMEFGFLGTGASRPSKYRNVTSQYVIAPDRSLIVLDCGEGTLGQLVRLHGPAAQAVLASLKCVAVSHLHADHHLGLVSLLQRAGRGVAVLAPAPLLHWAAEMREWHAPPNDRDGWSETWFDLSKALPDFIERLGMRMLQVPVVHCPMSYGFVVDWNDFKLV